jgi:hypothetical protein
MFCLQCGTAVHNRSGRKADAPALEETTDPILQKAITDTVRRPVHFKLPVSDAQPASKTKAFSSMRQILAPPRVAVAAGVAPAVPIEHERHVEPEPPPAPVVAPKPHEATPKKPLHIRWPGISPAWAAGAAAFGLFVAGNFIIQQSYANKIYPGVRVGTVDVGGMTEQAAAKALESSAPSQTLNIQVGPAAFDTEGYELGKPDIDRALREAMNTGHTTPLPLAGLLQARWSKPVELKYHMNLAAVQAYAKDLSAKLARLPANAVPVIAGSQAFVIPEKSGAKLNEAEVTEAIKRVYGMAGTLSLKSETLKPLVESGAYATDIQAAQAVMALNIKITARSTATSLTPAQIGQWIVFSGPGKGIQIDGARVSAYVRGLTGTFDRAATTTAIIGALTTKKDLAYTASTRGTSAPNLPAVAPTGPVVTYKYCADDAVKGIAQKTLAESNGWTMGGKVAFVADSDCHFRFEVLPAAQMAAAAPTCGGEVSCLSGSRLIFNANNWETLPGGWTGSLDSYRRELVNHETGHWLSFDHASCSGDAKNAPLLSAPSVVIPGCSPNWYAVPAEVQDTKVWAPL